MYVCLFNPVPASADLCTPRLTFRVPPDLIDKATKEIRQDEDQITYKSLDAIADDLPDHTPRFILLSYPLTLVRSPALPSCSCLSPRPPASPPCARLASGAWPREMSSLCDRNARHERLQQELVP